MGAAETTLKNRRRGRLKVVLIVLLVLLVFGTPVIIYFRISADGRIALREAKNIKLSFQMISIEYYSMETVSMIIPGRVAWVKESGRGLMKSWNLREA